MDTPVSDDNWGVHGTIVFLIVAALITDILFKQFLIYTAVKIPNLVIYDYAITLTL